MKKLILRWLKEAQHRLLLDHWTILVHWKLKTENTLMDCMVLNEYRTAYIGVNLKVCRESQREYGLQRVKVAAYHEMAHVLIWRLAEAKNAKRRREEDEKLAEVIAKIILS